MKKAVIYPFTLRQEYLVEHTYKFKDIALIGKVVPASWRASVKAKDDDFSEKITENSKLLEEADMVFVPRLDESKAEYRKIRDEILRENSKRCEIILNDNESGNESEYKETKVTGEKDVESPQNIWQELETPIIYVGETKAGPYGAMLTENLAEAFRGRGYTVTAIIDDDFAEWIGEKKTPDFIESNIASENKILLLNKFLKDIERIEKPEIIIAQIPGNTVRLDNFLERSFEINSFIYAQAAAPDVFIQTVPLNMSDAKTKENIKINCLHRFGFETDIFYTTNCYVDNSRTKYLGGVKEMYIEPSRFVQKITDMDLASQKYNCFNDESVESIVDYVESEFGS